MAKKQAAEGAAAETKPADGAAPEKAEGKKRGARAKAEPAADKAPEAKAPEAAPAPAAEKAPAAAAAPSEASKKNKRPGVPPRRGKKLRNHVKNVGQRLAKEGAMPLAKAIAMVKQIKRSKFDETVEIHMNLG